MGCGNLSESSKSSFSKKSLNSLNSFIAEFKYITICYTCVRIYLFVCFNKFSCCCCGSRYRSGRIICLLENLHKKWLLNIFVGIRGSGTTSTCSPAITSPTLITCSTPQTSPTLITSSTTPTSLTSIKFHHVWEKVFSSSLPSQSYGFLLRFSFSSSDQSKGLSINDVTYFLTPPNTFLWFELKSAKSFTPPP
jgi:hypothetical protein